MAKTTEWLNAILDYMKKVKLSISMVPLSQNPNSAEHALICSFTLSRDSVLHLVVIKKAEV